MDALTIRRATTPTPDVSALLEAHFDLMRATSPAESCHVMAPSDVFDAADVVLCAYDGAVLLGIGALKALDADHTELKSMHTTAHARGRGVGRVILHALIEQAQADGHNRISLETGSAPDFAPARTLYEAEQFVICPPFGTYTEDPLSVFMTRQL